MVIIKSESLIFKRETTNLAIKNAKGTRLRPIPIAEKDAPKECINKKKGIYKHRKRGAFQNILKSKTMEYPHKKITRRKKLLTGVKSCRDGVRKINNVTKKEKLDGIF